MDDKPCIVDKQEWRHLEWNVLKGTLVNQESSLWSTDLKIPENFIPREDEEREKNISAIITHSSLNRWDTDNYSVFPFDLLYNIQSSEHH